MASGIHSLWPFSSSIVPHPIRCRKSSCEEIEQKSTASRVFLCVQYSPILKVPSQVSWPAGPATGLLSPEH